MAFPANFKKKMSPAKDAKLDKAAGIKPGSPKDNLLDKKRGVPVGMGQGKGNGKKGC